MTEPNSKVFREMADRIDHNPVAEFAGAAVIVPPPNGGATLEVMILDKIPDAAQFWSAVLTRSKLILDDLEREKQQRMGMMR